MVSRYHVLRVLYMQAQVFKQWLAPASSSTPQCFLAMQG